MVFSPLIDLARNCPFRAAEPRVPRVPRLHGQTLSGTPGHSQELQLMGLTTHLGSICQRGEQKCKNAVMEIVHENLVGG